MSTRSCMSGTSFLCELRASVRFLRLLAGFPDLRLGCPIRHPVGIRRSPACLHAPCLTIPLAPRPPTCEQVGSSPVRVPTLTVSWFRIKQEPSGLPEFSDVSLPACQILRTPADIHTLAIERVLHVDFQDVKTVAIRLLCFLEAPYSEQAHFRERDLRRLPNQGPTEFSVYACPAHLFAGHKAPRQDQHSIRVGGQPLPDRDIYPARDAELCSAR